MVSGRVRACEGPGGDGDEGHPKPAEASEIDSSGGGQRVGLREEGTPVEAPPVSKLPGGAERRRVAAAKLRLACARVILDGPGPNPFGFTGPDRRDFIACFHYVPNGPYIMARCLFKVP